MKLSEAIDDIDALKYATSKTLSMHLKLVRKAVQRDDENRVLVESIRAHEQNIKSLITLVDQALSLSMVVAAKMAKNTAYIGELEGKRKAKAEIKLIASERGRNNVKIRHEKDNFAAKKEKIQKIWLSGKYDTKAICAEEEYSSLGMSFDTARKALNNLPKPKQASTN